MKILAKLILSVGVFLAVLSVLIPVISYAQFGPVCESRGGSCEATCFAGQKNIGILDCPYYKGVQHTCCASIAGGKYFKPPECSSGIPFFKGEVDYPGIKTAIGCLPTYPTIFVRRIYFIFLGIGGGIAFLLMIIGAVFVLSSQGQPERVQRGKEVFIGALIGLLMMIFATFLFELIGVDVLGLF